MHLVERSEQREALRIKLKLRNPPNAVMDNGIDLKRKPVPPVVPEPDPVVMPVLPQPIPYGLGNIHPDIQVTFSPAPTRIDVMSIIKAVARRYKVSVTDIRSPRRSMDVVLPRHIAMHLAKELTENSLPRIGALFGGRDHTTVLHAVRKIKALRQVDSALDLEVNEIAETVRGQAHPIVSVSAVNPPSV
jgi:hypothetical protein